MRVAVVDIGTNTTRLLIADVFRDGPRHKVAWIERHSMVTRLGQGVDETGSFAGEAIERTIDVLKDYRSAIDRCNVVRVGAVATSATRDVSDTSRFLDRAAAVLEARPEVIDGGREASLAFAGVRSARKADSAVVVIDIGGGSTEFVAGLVRSHVSMSVDIGSVRITERCLPDLPPSSEQLEAARTLAASEFAVVDLAGFDQVHHASAAGDTSPLPAVCGVGGTFTTLAGIHLGLEHHDPGVVHHSVIAASDLEVLVARLSRMDRDELEAIPSLEPDRAPVVVGGAIIASEALRCIGAERVVVSESDMLDGLAVEVATKPVSS